MAIKYIIVLFVETPRKFITAKLSIRKPGSSSVLIINLRGVSSKIYYPNLYLNDVGDWNETRCLSFNEPNSLC